MNNSLLQKLYRFRLEALFVISMCWLYGTYAMQAHPVSDDWWVISTLSQSSSFQDFLGYWMKTVTHRPIYAVLLSTFVWLFKANVWAYVILTSAVWCTGVIITAQALRGFISYHEKWIFIFLGCVPIMSAATLFASVQLIAASFAFLFWSISFHFQIKAFATPGWRFLISSFIFGTLSLLTYEVTLPLIAFSAATVLVRTNWTGGEIVLKIRNVIIQTWPQWGALLVVALYKGAMHLIFPAFLLKVEERSWIERSLSIFDWIFATFISFPIFLITSLSHRLTFETLQSPAAIVSILLASFFPLVLFSISSSEKNATTNNRLKFLFAIVVCIFSSMAIFFISGYGARIEGLGTRLWAGTWILISIFTAIILGRIAIHHNGKYIVSAVLAVVMLSYCVQMHGYLRSSELATKVSATLFSLIEKQNYTEGDAIIGNVPRFIPDNLNNEPVLEEVYLQRAIQAIHPERQWAAAAICPPVIVVDDATLIPKGFLNSSYIGWEDGEIRVFRPGGLVWKHPATSGIWFYDFDFVTDEGTLERLETPDELKFRVDTINETSGNRYKQTLTERLRDWLKHQASDIVTLERAQKAE